MRIFSNARWALPALLLLWPAIPTVAFAATPSAYACFGISSQTIDPRAKGCPGGSAVSVLTSISLGGTDIVQVGKAGKVNFSAINFAKFYDANSDKLRLLAEAPLSVISAVTIAVYQDGVKGPVYHIVLNDVTVRSWNFSATARTMPAPAIITESVSLLPKKFLLVDNVTGQIITWNLSTNSPASSR